jgi:hypothetical protein
MMLVRVRGVIPGFKAYGGDLKPGSRQPHVTVASLVQMLQQGDGLERNFDIPRQVILVLVLKQLMLGNL